MSLPGGLNGHILGLAHVGYIVEDLTVAVSNMQRVYGLSDDQVKVLPPQGQDAETRFAFLSINGHDIELIEPVSEHFKTVLLGMPSGSAGINHLAYEVDDIDAAMASLAGQGIRPGHVTPDGVIDIGPRKLVYLNPADTGGLVIELLEMKA